MQERKETRHDYPVFVIWFDSAAAGFAVSSACVSPDTQATFRRGQRRTGKTSPEEWREPAGTESAGKEACFLGMGPVQHLDHPTCRNRHHSPLVVS
jgi:hypothetical protein